MADYKIQLGVSLDTSDLKTEINKLDDRYKVKLGVDLKVNDIRDRITQYNKNTNNAKLKLGVKLDTDDLKKQINNLNLGGTEKGVAIPVNTEPLKSSLEKIDNIVDQVRKSLGSLDDVNTKSLVTAVNQIANALEKATNESDGLVASLRTLANKDFSVNFGFNMGKSASQISSEQGDVKRDAISQLKQQAKALEDYLDQYYKVSQKQEGVVKLTQGTNLFSSFWEMSPNIGNTKNSLKQQVATYKQYIDLMQEAAKIKGIDLSSVTSGFSKTTDDIVKGTNEATNSVEELKQSFKGLFGSGIDSEVLTGISQDLAEIKKAFEALSSIGTIDGLTTSFKELSEVLDKLTSNITTVKKSLDDIGNVGSSVGQGNNSVDNLESGLKQVENAAENAADAIKQISHVNSANVGLENIESDLSQVTATADNTSTAIERMQSTLAKSRISSSSIEFITKDLEEMHLEIQKITTKVNGNDINVSVKGLDDLGRAVTVVKKFTDLSDGVQTVGKTISQTFETSSDAAKRLEKEVIATFKKLKSLAQDMGKIDIEISGLEANGEIDKANSLKRVLNDIESEFKDLYNTVENNLSLDQIKELDKVFADTTGAVRDLKRELSETAEAKELISGLERLKSITKEIAQLNIDIFKFEDTDNIERATSRLNELENEAVELRTELSKKLPSTAFDQIDDIAENGKKALSDLINKAIEAKTKLAESIKVDIEVGKFDDDISKMMNNFNNLSGASKDLYENVEKVEQAYREMEKAAGLNDDEVVDTERLVKAQQEYAKYLEKTNNLIRQQAREEKAKADAQKLEDDRDIFQRKIDTWLTKNSAATKQFGNAMLKLKAQAESCDKVTLNHLEKQFTKLDKVADKAGLKVESLGDRIKSKFREYSAYLSAAEVFMYAEQALTDMFEQVKLIDSAMTELKKVTDETDASYNRFLSNAASRAKEIGTTIDGLVTSTADFARLGYGFDEAQGLAEVANIYAVVGDEIDGVEDATQSLVSTLTAFKNEANGLSDSDFALSIVDKMNEVSNNFAISSGGIGEALSRSASSMSAANNSLDETIALITAANTVVQDPASVGTAFKTISMRIRGAKTE